MIIIQRVETYLEMSFSSFLKVYIYGMTTMNTNSWLVKIFP